MTEQQSIEIQQQFQNPSPPQPEQVKMVRNQATQQVSMAGITVDILVQILGQKGILTPQEMCAITQNGEFRYQLGTQPQIIVAGAMPPSQELPNGTSPVRP